MEALGKSSTRMKHMNAIVFCRPTTESIRKLVDELRDPKYNEYYICTFAAGGRASGFGAPPEWSDTPHLRVRNRAKPSADFSNIVRSNVIEQLAEADQTAVVKEVQVRTTFEPPSLPPSLFHFLPFPLRPFLVPLRPPRSPDPPRGPSLPLFVCLLFSRSCTLGVLRGCLPAWAGAVLAQHGERHRGPAEPLGHGQV